MINYQETAAAKEQLKALESRHADFVKLEASVRVVHEMFLDVSNLVQMQGEMVTRIEDHVNSEFILNNSNCHNPSQIPKSKSRALVSSVKTKL